MNALDLARLAAKQGAHLYNLVGDELPFEYAAKPFTGWSHALTGEYFDWDVLDSFTAGFIVQTFEGMNTEQRESFQTLSITAMSRVAMRLAGVPT